MLTAKGAFGNSDVELSTPELYFSPHAERVIIYLLTSWFFMQFFFMLGVSNELSELKNPISQTPK